MQHLQQKGPDCLGRPQLALPPGMTDLAARLMDRFGGQTLGHAALDCGHGIHDTWHHGWVSGRGEVDSTPTFLPTDPAFSPPRVPPPVPPPMLA